MDINASITQPRFRGLKEPGLIAHMMALTHFIERETMARLSGTHRYPRFSLAYEGYISRLAEQDYPPGELALKLNVSKQACSKTVKELEQQGLIERRPNPADSRSSLLSLSGKGRQLVKDGIEITNAIHHRFAKTVGEQSMTHLTETLDTLCEGLGVNIPEYRVVETLFGEFQVRRPSRLNILVPRLSDFFYQSLILSLGEKGFEGLRPHFSQVLSLIIPDGGRIQYIASVIGVSKQAIAMTATELEGLGYILREPDPNDRRQVILRLSPLGEQLLTASEASVQALLERVRAILGDVEYRLLEETMAKLYARGIDHLEMPLPSASHIESLSRQLLEELGAPGARALAQQLTTITRGNT